MGGSTLGFSLLLGLSLGLCVTRPALSASQPTPTQIRQAAEAFDRGREAYKNEDYVSAAEQFERADAQAGSPTALEYAIRSRDRASQLDRAATLAALVGKRYPDNAALVKLANDVQERARGSLYELSVQCGDPCDLAVDDKIVPGEPDLTRTIFLPAGRHSVRAGFGNETGGSEEIQATSGGKGRVSFDAPAPAVAPTPEASTPTAPPPVDKGDQKKERSGWSPTVFWIGAGLTGAIGIATTWSGIDTLNNPGKDKIRDNCMPQDTSCSYYQEGLANQRRTNILLGATAAVGVTTILIGVLATDWGGSNAAPEPDKPEDEYAVTLSKARARRARMATRVRPWMALGNGALLGAEGRF
ncbi:MAG: hypothetical protein ACOY0T_04710 [Myxococcota bacterium]